MRKKEIIAIIGLLAFSIAGCASGKNANEDVQTEATVIVGEDTVAEEADNNVEDESKVEDFETCDNGDGTISILGYNGDASVVNIPEEVDGLKVTSVSGVRMNDSIAKIVIPDSVITIEDGAFKDNSNLEEVVMGNNVEVIGESAFERDGKLERISLPETLKEIGSSAFVLTGLKEVTIPSGVSALPHGAFGITNLETITIPGTVKEIGDRVFEDCHDLKTVIIEEGVETIDKSAFNDTESLTRVELPSSITSIDCKFNDGCTIVAPSGSAAESYANERGYTFEAK